MHIWNRRIQDEDISISPIIKCRRKGDLLAFLQTTGRLYTPDDLEIMMEKYAGKIRDLPAEYRNTLKKYATVQIVDGYHQMMTCLLDKIHLNEKLPKQFRQFASTAPELCIRHNEGDRHRILKYLIAAFTIFILEAPVHPVGMPFPGGLTVEKYDGTYYCPVRAVWNEIDDAYCRFCPAVQSREQDMSLSRKERDFVTASEKLTNYFYNFKG